MTPGEVRERFRWAKRQGNPAWLWPDVSGNQWREALASIEAVLRPFLQGQPIPGALKGEPDALTVAAYTSGTGPLLGWMIESDALAAEAPLETLLRLHLDHNRRRVEQLTREATGLVRALGEHGIRATLLKGLHTAHAYFPDPGTRPASDIDLLIEERDQDAANQMLESAGFIPGRQKRWERDWRRPAVPRLPRSLGMVHCDDPRSVDLHTSLNVQTSAGSRVIRLDAAMPAEARGAWPLDPAAAVLLQPLLLLHLAVHAGSGLQNLTLLRLAEIRLVVARDVAAGTLDWNMFLHAAERSGALALAYPALSMCQKLVPGTIPDAVLTRCAEAAPATVRRFMARLTPATAHRVDRSSITEHFMWSGNWRSTGRQLVSDLIHPLRQPLPDLVSIYHSRAWRLLRGTFQR